MELLWGCPGRGDLGPCAWFASHEVPSAECVGHVCGLVEVAHAQRPVPPESWGRATAPGPAPWEHPGDVSSLCFHVLLLLHIRAGRSCPGKGKGLHQEQPVLGMEEGSPGGGARMRAGRVVERVTHPQSSLFPLASAFPGIGEEEGVTSPGRGDEAWRGAWRVDPAPQGASPRGSQGPHGHHRGAAGEGGGSRGLPRHLVSSSDAANTPSIPCAPPIPPPPPSQPVPAGPCWGW